MLHNIFVKHYICKWLINKMIYAILGGAEK